MVEPGDEPDAIRFLVRDTGIGIAPEAQPRIFGLRNRPTAARRASSAAPVSGLRSRAASSSAWAARSRCKSAPGEGSTFSFTVTLRRAAGSPTGRLSRRPTFPARPSDRRPGHDRGAADRAAARPLGRQDLPGARRHSRRAATAQSSQWDALLVDRALGLEAASALARDAMSVPRRIVLVTPGERHELADLKPAGFTGYLVKPVRAASLAARFWR